MEALEKLALESAPRSARRSTRPRAARRARNDGTVYPDRHRPRFVVRGPWDGHRKHYVSFDGTKEDMLRAKREAESLRRKLAGQAQQQDRALKDPDLCLSDWIDRWLSMRDEMNPRTKAADRARAPVLKTYLGRKRMREITALDCYEYLNKTLPKVAGIRMVSTRTRHRELLTNVMNTAVRLGVAIGSSPAQRIKILDSDPGDVFKAKVLSPRQWKALVASARDFDRRRRIEAAPEGEVWLPYRGLIEGGLYHVMREGELLGLSWPRLGISLDADPNQIDWEHLRVRVEQQLQADRGSPQINALYSFAGTTLQIVPLKRSEGKRNYPADERAVPAIREMFLIQRAIRKRDRHWNPANLVWPWVDGIGLTSKRFDKDIWVPIATSAGIPLLRNDSEGFRFHDTRATGITRRLEAGQPIKSVQRMAGHLRMETLMKYVGLATDAEFDRSVRKGGRGLP